MGRYFHILEGRFVSQEFGRSFHEGRVEMSYFTNTFFLGVL